MICQMLTLRPYMDSMEDAYSKLRVHGCLNQLICRDKTSEGYRSLRISDNRIRDFRRHLRARGQPEVSVVVSL